MKFDIYYIIHVPPNISSGNCIFMQHYNFGVPSSGFSRSNFRIPDYLVTYYKGMRQKLYSLHSIYGTSSDSLVGSCVSTSTVFLLVIVVYIQYKYAFYMQVQNMIPALRSRKPES